MPPPISVEEAVTFADRRLISISPSEIVFTQRPALALGYRAPELPSVAGFLFFGLLGPLSPVMLAALWVMDPVRTAELPLWNENPCLLAFVLGFWGIGTVVVWEQWLRFRRDRALYRAARPLVATGPMTVRFDASSRTCRLEPSSPLPVETPTTLPLDRVRLVEGHHFCLPWSDMQDEDDDDSWYDRLSLDLMIEDPPSPFLSRGFSLIDDLEPDTHYGVAPYVSTRNTEAMERRRKAERLLGRPAELPSGDPA